MLFELNIVLSVFIYLTVPTVRPQTHLPYSYPEKVPVELVFGIPSGIRSE
jgi:hypothetical protein